METDGRRSEENSRDSASRSGSLDSTSAAKPVESLDSSMDMNDGKGGSEHEMQSGRVHKGGRKLIYATLEERKERNRQAQATFRERRIFYVAQLEKTIQEQREELRRLQNACSSATDERLNLKYKNSLLERILLEKGIEVRAELDAEIPVQLPSKKGRKERQPSIRRSKQPTPCRRHSYIASETKPVPEICSCHPIMSHDTQSFNPQRMANNSGHHVIESKQPLPPNMVRWQQTHGAQNMDSQTYDPNIAKRRSSVSHLGPDTLYNPYQQTKYQNAMPNPSYNPHPTMISASRPSSTDFSARDHLAHLDPEWSSSSSSGGGRTNMLRNREYKYNTYYVDEEDGCDNVIDDEDADQFASDRFDNTTATHSSPISTVRTPPDFVPAAQLQLQQAQQQQKEQQFSRHLDGGVVGSCFDLVDARVESALHAYHAGYDVARDPFGLDASLFSI